MAIKRYIAENKKTGEVRPLQGRTIRGIRADIKQYVETQRWDTCIYHAEDWTITEVGRE